MSEGHEVMLKAEGMFRENMGSSIWSRGNVVARSFLSTRVGGMPRGRVRDGDRVRLSGLVSTIFFGHCCHFHRNSLAAVITLG